MKNTEKSIAHFEHNDYQHQDEPWDRERDAHIRTIRRLVGRREE